MNSAKYSSQNPKYTVMLKCSTDAQIWAFLFSRASQVGHISPDNGSCESKCIQKMASVTCAHGVQVLDGCPG